MFDMGSKSSGQGGASGGLARTRSFKKRSRKEVISASYGVRNGYIAEAERPLPPGATNQRSAKRIPLSFEAAFDGQWRRVAGDVSAGGALILSAAAAPSDRVVQLRISLGGRDWHLYGQVLRTQRRGERFAHHVRFVQGSQTEGLNETVEQGIEN